MYCTFTNTAQMFSQLNAPFFEGAPYLEDIVQDLPPCVLVRQTNDWQGYFGKYPEFCARITTEPQIDAMIGRGYRHVARIPIDLSNRSIAQREIVDKVEGIATQLERFRLSWSKFPGKIVLARTEVPGVEPIYNDHLSIEFFVCNDSGYFHVLVSKPAMFTDGEIFHPDMEDDKLNQLIFCIRLLFMDRDPADEFPILTHNLWEMAVHLTLTPDFDRVEFYPEWMDDDFPDWFLPEPPQDLWTFMDQEPFDERFLFYA